MAKQKKVGPTPTAQNFSYQGTVSAKILQQSKGCLGSFLFSKDFDIFVGCYPTHLEALTKISAHLVGNKNKKVHRQNARGSKTVF
jgi:hypothetical protein